MDKETGAGAGESLLGPRQTGGVGICERYETSGEKVRRESVRCRQTMDCGCRLQLHEMDSGASVRSPKGQEKSLGPPKGVMCFLLITSPERETHT